MRSKENYALLEKIEVALWRKRAAGVPHMYPEWDQKTDEDEHTIPDLVLIETDESKDNFKCNSDEHEETDSSEKSWKILKKYRGE